MSKPSALIAVIFTASLATSPSYAASGSDITDFIEATVSEVINSTISQAEEEVQETVGIDVESSGYSEDVEHEVMPDDADDEVRYELKKLDEQHDRKVYKLQEELEKKLRKAQAEFERESKKSKKKKQVEKKREKLERKVDKAYFQFEKKLDAENIRYDKKRNQILRSS